jgi:hypothetical protein
MCPANSRFHPEELIVNDICHKYWSTLHSVRVKPLGNGRSVRTEKLELVSRIRGILSGHLPRLVDDIVARLVKHELPSKDSDAEPSNAALEHGLLRREQRYTPAMLIHESRILQVTIFGILQKISALDFNLSWLDVMIIADEVDAQLTQTMESFTNGSPALEKTHLHLLKANG